MERVDVDLATTAPHPALRRFVRYCSQRRIVPGDDLQEPVTARLGGLFEFHFESLYRIPIVGTDRFESCAPMLVVGPITYRRLQLTADGTVESLTVMFQPFGLYELFGVPTNLLTEHLSKPTHSSEDPSRSSTPHSGKPERFPLASACSTNYCSNGSTPKTGRETHTGHALLPWSLRIVAHTLSAS